MQTVSHFLMTAAANHQLRQKTVPLHTKALLIGSVLPDIPFALLTIAGEIYYRWFAVLPTDQSIMEYLHLDLFFTDPLWIISHNFFHSLVINTLLILLGVIGIRSQQSKNQKTGPDRSSGWGLALFWLAISTQFHTIIDIFTHHSDGPLLFFPLNWTYRFPSPISYWETAYYARPFIAFEYLLDALIIGYLVRIWLRRRGKESEKMKRHQMKNSGKHTH